MSEPTDEAAARPPRERKCAICRKPAVPEYRPFCSRRCADVDLGRWLGGAYVVPGRAQGEGDEDGQDDGDDVEAPMDAAPKAI